MFESRPDNADDLETRDETRGETQDAPDDTFVEGREILSLTPTDHDAGRLMVRVGRPGKKGRVQATMNIARIADLGLYVGQAWDEQLAQTVADEATYDKAMRQAMYAIGRRSLSRRELDQKLMKREHSPALRERVLDRLTELGLLNDKAYAHALVRQTVRGKPAGPRLLKQKLRQKGIPEKIADKAVAQEQPDQATQREQAKELAEKRLASMTKLDAMAKKRRIYGLLVRRGFEMDVVQDVMDQLRPMMRDSSSDD